MLLAAVLGWAVARADEPPGENRDLDLIPKAAQTPQAPAPEAPAPAGTTRKLYLENAFTIPAGLSQLAAGIADRELGQAVFGDPYRMWRDLLGDVAKRHARGGFFPEMGKPD